VRANLQPSFGQCLNNPFCYLLGFLRTDFLLRTFFEALANRGRNYRNHLIDRPIAYAPCSQIVLHVTLGHHLNQLRSFSRSK
jgi:hypothetical protein